MFYKFLITLLIREFRWRKHLLLWVADCSLPSALLYCSRTSQNYIRRRECWWKQCQKCSISHFHFSLVHHSSISFSLQSGGIFFTQYINHFQAKLLARKTERNNASGICRCNLSCKSSNPKKVMHFNWNPFEDFTLERSLSFKGADLCLGNDMAKNTPLISYQ